MPHKDWSEYYNATATRPPRQLLVKALEYVTHTRKAMDLGGGALSDAIYLIDHGFDVTVVDKSSLVEQRASDIPSDKLHAYTSDFEEFDFSTDEYDLIIAMFSLPFISPVCFEDVFQNIKNSLTKGGIYCGQFFGDRDEWSTNLHMTFHTKDQVETLLEGLEILLFKEDEKDGTTATGDMKHWHVFHVIARKG